MANHEYSHVDERHWEKPHQFYPEHFIDERGDLISNKEGFYPFSAGKFSSYNQPTTFTKLFIVI